MKFDNLSSICQMIILFIRYSCSMSASTMVGWTEGNVLRIPVWQFREGKLLKGVEEILQIFHSDDQWRVVRYFLGKRRSLAKERPVDLLRRGESAKVIKHATEYSKDNKW